MPPQPSTPDNKIVDARQVVRAIRLGLLDADSLKKILVATQTWVGRWAPVTAPMAPASAATPGGDEREAMRRYLPDPVTAHFRRQRQEEEKEEVPEFDQAELIELQRRGILAHDFGNLDIAEQASRDWRQLRNTRTGAGLKSSRLSFIAQAVQRKRAEMTR